MSKSNVVFVNFQTKQVIAQAEPQVLIKPAMSGKRKPSKRMTKGELHALSVRVDEINNTLDLCDPDHDSDVIENLERELSQLEAKLGAVG